ncbi:hypothetical protein BG011_004658 [Mortierella polycephala]|uniref:IQ calmodulin-binding motif protein n=1 Tax=Mortierella polycephala TaxID=41804 RepID=A0A9P6PY00_9FUNG|nr:hypothetical protein BG011_004658 [Mortierella polycephala]
MMTNMLQSDDTASACPAPASISNHPSGTAEPVRDSLKNTVEQPQLEPSDRAHCEGNSVHDKDTVSADMNQDCASTKPLPNDEQAKLESAATLIQSAYRGYQTRRELYGTALTASQKWRHLIDYSRAEYIHKMDASDKCYMDQNQDRTSTSGPGSPNDLNEKLLTSPRSPTASWTWRRAGFLGSRLGKGGSGVATDEALVLLTEHWLEMSDKEHRYGSNLKNTEQNFFFWLDKGEGKDVDLEERSRAKLDEQRVQYLQEHERAHFAVHAIDGLLYYRVSGEPVHTLPASHKTGDDIDISQVLVDADDQDDEETRLEKKRIRNKNKYIYVTDPNGTLYIGLKKKGRFHHSSFLGGGTVCAAGAIVVNHGKLIKINPNSGHYRPGQRHFDRLLESLKSMGVSFEDAKISYGILDNPTNDGGE